MRLRGSRIRTSLYAEGLTLTEDLTGLRSENGATGAFSMEAKDLHC